MRTSISWYFPRYTRADPPEKNFLQPHIQAAPHVMLATKASYKGREFTYEVSTRSWLKGIMYTTLRSSCAIDSVTIFTVLRSFMSHIPSMGRFKFVRSSVYNPARIATER
jgi:hypothetical protein